MIIMKNKHVKSVRMPASGSKALTLVESLVAISILVIAVFGPMSIVAQSIRTAYLTRDQMTAFYLAQEAVEYVRNIKDQNSLRYSDPATWISGLDGTGRPTINVTEPLTPVKYMLQLSAAGGYELIQCATCPKLNVNKVTREYGAPEVGGDDVASIYTREVSFWSVPLDDLVEKEVVVQVVVRWSHTGNNYEYTVRDNLRNWKITP